MTEKEEQIEVKNLSLTIEGLKQEAVIVSGNLSTLYKKKKKAKQSMDAFEDERKEKEEDLENTRLKIVVEKKAIKQDRDKLTSETIIHISNIRELKIKEKALGKSLNKLNNYILGVKDEIGELESDRVKLKEELKIRKEKLAEHSSLESDISLLSNEKDTLVKEIGDKSADYTAIINAGELKLEELGKATGILTKEADMAESRKLEMDREYKRKMRNIAIIEKRLKRKFARRFPNTVLKL